MGSMTKISFPQIEETRVRVFLPPDTEVLLWDEKFHGTKRRAVFFNPEDIDAFVVKLLAAKAKFEGENK